MPYGQNAVIGIAIQNSGGTPAAVGSTVFHPFISEDVGVARPELLSKNMYFNFWGSDPYQGPSDGGGSIEFEPQPIPVGQFFRALMGAATKVTSGGIATHTWNPRTADFDQSFPSDPVTVLKDLREGEGAFQMYDMNVGRMELRIANGQILGSTWGLVGGGEVNSVAQVDSFAPDTGRRWTWDVCSVSIANSGYIDVVDLTLVLDEHLAPRYTLGKRGIRYITRESEREVIVSGTLKYRTQSEWTAYLNETVRQLIITATTTTQIQSGYYEVLKLIVPSFKLTDYKPAVGGPGAIERPFTGRALFNAGSGTGLTVVLVNTMTAGY